MKSCIFFVCLVLLSSFSMAAATVEELQQGWAVANYDTMGDAQEAAFKTLIQQAEAAVAASPNDPALLIWKGIIQSTFAGKTSGFTALRLVKAARVSLTEAMEQDDMALEGSAYTSLGALYYQVPGWPIAFGDDKKARQLLNKAIQVNPNGIDSNYFYGDFLLQKKEYVEARSHLERALAAPARPGRELADKGRREEINRLLATLNSKA